MEKPAQFCAETNKYRNCAYNRHGTIDMEINHTVHGWIPYTASPDDWVEECVEMYHLVLAEAEIGPYVPPTPEEQRERMAPLSRVAFRTAFKNAGMTTAVITAAIFSVPDESEQEDLQIVWEDAQSFKRLDPLVGLIASRADKTAEQIDAIWNAALAV
ncbi:hypothetical protein [Mycoplana azooxidifex]|uniref:hypothetical protein n=1 Tax=Mycoplana azooxidifex TaxID=1636188 RepID=UPI00161FCECD|nr:hypothetical protein [Mycoplana azooxidifex]